MAVSLKLLDSEDGEFLFNMYNENGVFLGFIHLIDEGEVLEILLVDTSQSSRPATPGEFRGVLRLLRQKFPKAKHITGDRETGTRSSGTGNISTRVSLR